MIEVKCYSGPWGHSVEIGVDEDKKAWVSSKLNGDGHVFTAHFGFLPLSELCQLSLELQKAVKNAVRYDHEKSIRKLREEQ